MSLKSETQLSAEEEAFRQQQIKNIREVLEAAYGEDGDGWSLIYEFLVKDVYSQSDFVPSQEVDWELFAFATLLRLEELDAIRKEGRLL